MNFRFCPIVAPRKRGTTDRNRCKAVTTRLDCHDLPYRRPALPSNPVKGEYVLLGRLYAAAEEAAPLVTRAVANLH